MIHGSRGEYSRNMRGNARITKRTDGRPNPWLVRWVEDDGTQRKGSFRTKAAAEEHVRQLTASDVRGDYVSPGAGRVTVAEFGGPWLDAHAATLKPKSASSARSLWRRVEARWGTARLDAVKPSAVSTWTADMTAEGLSPSRVRQAVNLLGHALDAAVRDGLISRNPARGTALPRLRTAREHRYLTLDELERVAAACGPHEALVLLLGTVGLRWAEAVGLRVGAVDMLRRRIRVTSTLSEVDGTFHEVAPKSHAARTVAVPAFVVEHLAPLLAGKGRDDLVFATAAGTPLRSANFTRRTFVPGCEAAGVDRLRVHELRHTAASLMIASGASVLAVAATLGHADPSLTLRIYGGLFRDELGDVADRMDAARSPRHRPGRAPGVLREGSGRL
jgi:integrase